MPATSSPITTSSWRGLRPRQRPALRPRRPQRGPDRLGRRPHPGGGGRGRSRGRPGLARRYACNRIPGGRNAAVACAAQTPDRSGTGRPAPRAGRRGARPRHRPLRHSSGYRMKILFAATPVAGHLNPLLAIARMVLARGDEAVVATATYLRPPSRPRAPASCRSIPARISTSPGSRTCCPSAPACPRAGAAALQFRAPLPRSDAGAGRDAAPIIATDRPDIVVVDDLFFGTTPLFLDRARPRRRSSPAASRSWWRTGRTAPRA